MELAVCIKTVGCRTNQADSLEIRRRILHLPVKITQRFDEADVIIINSCAVTARAERDVRLYLGQARRRAPGALVAVTGCMTEVAPPETWAKYGALYLAIFPNRQKMLIPQWLEGMASGNRSGASPMLDVHRPPLKVQEGCTVGCSYCIVPRTRGRERSVPPEEVFEKIRWLEQQGAAEIVLTGVQLGSWGRDFDSPLATADLLRMVLGRGFRPRIRLGSIEPWGVDDSLVEIFAGRDPRLCPHLHSPLQSGCDGTLQRMRRPYSTARYASIMAALLEADPDLAVGTDVIVGFPGESDEEFESTLRFIDSLPFAYLHVFSFSGRRGTDAAWMKGQVGAEKTRERMRVLKRLDATKRGAYCRKFMGRNVEAVIEKASAGQGLSGTTGQFFRVLVPQEHEAPQLVGTTMEVRPVEYYSNKVVALPV
jgi:threonylcarbamoyladenosine tRNA methylthiotransferase MtaB